MSLATRLGFGETNSFHSHKQSGKERTGESEIEKGNERKEERNRD